MTKLLIIAAVLLMSTSAFAQVTCTTVGGSTLCSNGASAQTLGNTTFYNFPPQSAPSQIYQPTPAPSPTFHAPLPSYSTKQCSWDYLNNRPC
jgi:hypothetical protein